MDASRTDSPRFFSTPSQINKKEAGRRKNNGGIPSLPHLSAGNHHPQQGGTSAEGRKTNKRRFIVTPAPAVGNQAINAQNEADGAEEEALEETEAMEVEDVDEEAAANM